MVTRRKKVSFKLHFFPIGDWQMISMMTSFEEEFNDKY